MGKVYTLSEAISKFVHNGDHICFGGFTTNRKPYAAVREILRQGLGRFHRRSRPAGGDWDMLIGEGRVKAYINCYTADSGVTNVSRRFRAAYEKGELVMEDYSRRPHAHAARRFARSALPACPSDAGLLAYRYVGHFEGSQKDHRKATRR